MVSPHLLEIPYMFHLYFVYCETYVARYIPVVYGDSAWNKQ